jgi:hypothetical protein
LVITSDTDVACPNYTQDGSVQYLTPENFKPLTSGLYIWKSGNGCLFTNINTSRTTNQCNQLQCLQMNNFNTIVGQNDAFACPNFNIGFNWDANNNRCIYHPQSGINWASTTCTPSECANAINVPTADNFNCLSNGPKPSRSSLYLPPNFFDIVIFISTLGALIINDGAVLYLLINEINLLQQALSSL